MDVPEIGRRLKAALERITESPGSEREAMIEALAKELMETSPEAVDMIRAMTRSGALLGKYFTIALRAALERPDLSVGEKQDALADSRDYLRAFGAVAHAPYGRCSSYAALDFAFWALMVGLNAGAPPEKIKEARALGRSDLGRVGGRRSARTRGEKAKKWQSFAVAESEKYEERGHSLSRAAALIAEKLGSRGTEVSVERVRQSLRKRR
jgi:hypothetical protein